MSREKDGFSEFDKIYAAPNAEASAKKDIYLSEFEPKSKLVVPEHHVHKPRFPVVDFHTHFGFWSDFDLDLEVEKFTGRGVKAVVNLNGFWGERLDTILRITEKYTDKFITFCSVDVSGIAEPGFASFVRRELREAFKKGAKGVKFLKDLSLYQKIPADDARLKPVWETCAELNITCLIHIGDPVAFFDPIDGNNERFEELNAHPQWSFCGDEFFEFEELMEMQENLLTNNPDTTFIIAHVGSYPENLRHVSQQMDRHPNMYIDIAARIAELGRQPYTAREFFLKHQDRILFGTDNSTNSDLYPYYYRFLETRDEYFDYFETMTQGRWKIYGIYLPDDVLEKVYYKNAQKLIPGLSL